MEDERDSETLCEFTLFDDNLRMIGQSSLHPSGIAIQFNGCRCLMRPEGPSDHRIYVVWRGLAWSRLGGEISSVLASLSDALIADFQAENYEVVFGKFDTLLRATAEGLRRRDCSPISDPDTGRMLQSTAVFSKYPPLDSNSPILPIH